MLLVRRRGDGGTEVTLRWSGRIVSFWYRLFDFRLDIQEDDVNNNDDDDDNKNNSNSGFGGGGNGNGHASTPT